MCMSDNGTGLFVDRAEKHRRRVFEMIVFVIFSSQSIREYYFLNQKRAVDSINSYRT